MLDALEKVEWEMYKRGLISYVAFFSSPGNVTGPGNELGRRAKYYGEITRIEDDRLWGRVIRLSTDKQQREEFWQATKRWVEEYGKTNPKRLQAADALIWNRFIQKDEFANPDRFGYSYYLRLFPNGKYSKSIPEEYKSLARVEDRINFDAPDSSSLVLRNGLLFRTERNFETGAYKIYDYIDADRTLEYVVPGNQAIWDYHEESRRLLVTQSIPDEEGGYALLVFDIAKRQRLAILSRRTHVEWAFFDPTGQLVAAVQTEKGGGNRRR